MVERRKLGRGLSTLIPTEQPAESPVRPGAEGSGAPHTAQIPASALRDVPIDSIEPNPHQPRVHFDEESLGDLSRSIKEIGVLQPLLVREIATDSYQLIAGERRWRAAQRAQLTHVPVVVRDITEVDSVEQALVENLHRQDLTALEEASAYQQLVEDFSLTHDQVAKRVGKSRAAISNALRLLQLPASIQGYLADGRLSAGHARALLACQTASAMEDLAAQAVKGDWSVRAVEEAVRTPRKGSSTRGDQPGDKGRALRPAGLLELENLLAEFLHTSVGVTMTGKRGKIAIDFADLADLERIYRRMTESAE